MHFVYPYTVEQSEDGAWQVRFPDVPEALTEGATEAEGARTRCRRAGERAWGSREVAPRHSRAVKAAPSRCRRRAGVPLSAKLALYQAMREHGLNNVTLSKKARQGGKRGSAYARSRSSDQDRGAGERATAARQADHDRGKAGGLAAASVTRIVTTAYRPKRPPRKRKAAAITGPAIVRKAKGAGVRCQEARADSGCEQSQLKNPRQPAGREAAIVPRRSERAKAGRRARHGAEISDGAATRRTHYGSNSAHGGRQGSASRPGRPVPNATRAATAPIRCRPARKPWTNRSRVPVVVPSGSSVIAAAR